jgi:receptor expression-enhancing protein 5/6
VRSDVLFLVVQTQVKNFVEKYDQLNKPLVQAAEKTKVEKEFIFVGALAAALLLLFFITGGDVIIDIIGFVYPFYMSLKAIETDDPEDDKQWLTYWIVFVLFKFTENVADVIISFIPFYFVFKVAFLVWCCHPTSKGAALVYDLVFKAYVVPALGLKGK